MTVWLQAAACMPAGAQFVAHPGDNVERVDAAELSHMQSFPSPSRSTPGCVIISLLASPAESHRVDCQVLPLFV